MVSKERYAEWAKLSATPRPKPAPLKMSELPGFLELEDKLLLYSSARQAVSPEVEEVANRVQRSTFGIVEADTAFVWPDDYWDYDEFSDERLRIERRYYEHERRFHTPHLSAPEVARYLLGLGLDFFDAFHSPLRCTKLVARSAEAAAKGLAGTMPDRVKVGIELWEQTLLAEAKAHLARKHAKSS